MNDSKSPRVNSKHGLVTLLLCLGLAVSVAGMVALAADEEYDNHVTFKFYPDGSVMLRAGMVSTGYIGSVELYDGLEAVQMSLDLETEGDETLFTGESSVQLSPEYASSLSNLELEFAVQGDAEGSQITLEVDYPGYVGISGDLVVTVVEPPFEGVITLDADVKLYYAMFPRESIEEMLAMVPQMETMLSAQVTEASDGNLFLSELEVTGSDLGETYATFSVSMTLEGDFQEGLQTAAGNMGLEYAQEDLELEEIPFTTLNSFDMSVTFLGESLTFEVYFHGTLTGDLDAQMNAMKDKILEEQLEDPWIDPDDEEMIEEFWLPTYFGFEELNLEADYQITGGEYTTSFSLEDLGLETQSYTPMLRLLEEMSSGSEADMKLVFEGESSGGQSVVMEVPELTTPPISEDSQRVVWDLEDLEDLDEVIFDVEESSGSSGLPLNLLLPAVGVVVVLAAAGFFLLRKG